MDLCEFAELHCPVPEHSDRSRVECQLVVSHRGLLAQSRVSDHRSHHLSGDHWVDIDRLLQENETLLEIHVVRYVGLGRL
jgi:hypothetical protein